MWRVNPLATSHRVAPDHAHPGAHPGAHLGARTRNGTPRSGKNRRKNGIVALAWRSQSDDTLAPAQNPAEPRHCAGSTIQGRTRRLRATLLRVAQGHPEHRTQGTDTGHRTQDTGHRLRDTGTRRLWQAPAREQATTKHEEAAPPRARRASGARGAQKGSVSILFPFVRSLLRDHRDMPGRNGRPRESPWAVAFLRAPGRRKHSATRRTAACFRRNAFSLRESLGSHREMAKNNGKLRRLVACTDASPDSVETPGASP